MDEKLQRCQYDVIPLKNLISEKYGVKDGPGGWLINKSEYVESGVPMLRGVNVADGHIVLDNVVYITEEKHQQLSASEVLPGDILITMRGTFGRAAILPASISRANMNAALCRIRLTDPSLGEYLMWYLNSQLAYKQFKRHGSKAVQDDLNLGYIKALQVIVPNSATRTAILDRLIHARQTSIQKFQQAEKLLESAKENALSKIGIEFSEYVPSLFGFSHLRDMREMGINCNSHSAYLSDVFSLLRKSKYYAGNLEDYVKVNPSINKKELNSKSIVSFVPMPAVSEKINSVTYQLKEFQEVKTGFTAFQKNDLLWAKITPCMQNGKSFLASEMPTEHGFGSTEFHVLRKKSDNIYLPYLWVLLSEEHVLEAAQGIFCGSAGQQRVPDTFLKKFPVVLPPFEMQQQLADEVFRSLDMSKRIAKEAEQEWQAAKTQFERELLGDQL